MSATRWVLLVLALTGWLGVVALVRWWFGILDAHIGPRLVETDHGRCPICTRHGLGTS